MGDFEGEASYYARSLTEDQFPEIWEIYDHYEGTDIDVIAYEKTIELMGEDVHKVYFGKSRRMRRKIIRCFENALKKEAEEGVLYMRLAAG